MTKFSGINSIQHNSPPDAVGSKSIETPLQTAPIPFLTFPEAVAAMSNFKYRDGSAAQSQTTQNPEPKGNDIRGHVGRENANTAEGTGPQIGTENTESAPSSPIAFRNLDIVIAVDVSRSTKRKVLDHEITAAQVLCNKSASTTIIPWDGQVHPSLAGQNVVRLRTDRGGTRPSALTSTLSSVNVLKACSAWLLFTDGEIIDREIRDFSVGICKNGLHGTTCVVVIFGRKTRKPVECNISVGVSLFGLVPNCLFLFHDVETSKVSILQSKGVFNQLLPDGCKNPSLDGSTHWWDLPTIEYGDLSTIEIPTPHKLDFGDILLQSNLIIRLKDVYEDRIEPATASEILENDDNLKTLLLTSEIAGQNTTVRNWISDQKLKATDVLQIPRPDINNSASTLIRQLLKNPEQSRSLQAQLRIAHKQNRTNFLSSITSEKEKVSRRTDIVNDALDRVASNAIESIQGSWGAKMIAPISKQKSKNPVSEYPEDSSPWNERSIDTPASAREVLFIPGYRHDPEPLSVTFRGECPLCGEGKAILALLVKEPHNSVRSPTIPEPNSHAPIEFPLAVGSYPEARIISSFVCCDACAYHLVGLSATPYDEKLIGAIPLISEAVSGNVKQTTLTTLDKALSKRFEELLLEQIFLSILYTTLMDLKPDDSVRRRALHWAASLISASISIPAAMPITLSVPHNSGHLEEDKLHLKAILRTLLDGVSNPNLQLLEYPLAGFIVIMQCTKDLNLDPTSTLLQKALFQRILYHLTQKYRSHVSEKGEESTIKDTSSLLWSTGTRIENEDFDIISTPALSISLSSLKNTFLLPLDDWNIMQRLGTLFDELNEKYSSAIAVFLHILFREQSTRYSTLMENFDKIRSRKEFCGALEGSWIFDEKRARALIDKFSPEAETSQRGLTGNLAEDGERDFDMLSNNEFQDML